MCSSLCEFPDVLFLVLFSEDGSIKSVLEKVDDSLLEMNRLMVLTELHTDIRLYSCFLGAWYPRRKSVAYELSITGFTVDFNPSCRSPVTPHYVVPCSFRS